MTLKVVVAVSVLVLGAAACSPSGGPSGRIATSEPPPAAVPAGMSVEEIRTTASGHSFLRPAAGDSYEVLYFEPGGRASLLRADQFQIMHGRWSAEMATVGSATTPTAALCLTFRSPDGADSRRCIDPSLLTAATTERSRGDVLGIGRWTSVPETLPRERASLVELRDRIRG
ncbi:hypothetical protein [Enterovirga rhinocerotis]|uniref:Uncharacterized protein n=1 Tax=Enterovirga rhinocerotis TaxID=1339210 RepID=A0A4R7C8Q9_9HYPH|nr:hypothetical protein [Enterovirga rhinocerotis]TDR94771.1 hypothetical protein EV668_2060 [Enterovirga rhinocerotis]